VGDQDLPLITGAGDGELSRSIALLRELREHDPEVFSRLSEIRPVAPDGFAIFDRQLGAVVYANASELSEKFRQMYAVANADGLGRSAIEYADLRFAGRIVMKPVKTPVLMPSAPPVVHATESTN
jgi:Cell division protein FtsQ.